MSNSLKAHLYFLLISVLWGATFPIIKGAVSTISADQFVFLRFFIGSLILLPFVCRTLKKNTTKPILIVGLVLGLLNGIAYFTQTLGLQTTSASRSAFITGMSVVFVPLFSMLWLRTRASLVEIIATLICLGGLFILTGASWSQFTVGDLMVLICAIAIALSIVYMQTVSIRFKDVKLVAFYQIILTCPLPLSVYLIQSPVTLKFTTLTVFALLFCAIFATVIPLFLQTKYQQYTSPTIVGLIFSLEPIFATIFSVLLFSEKMTASLLVGGSIILAGCMLPIFKSMLTRSRRTSRSC